MTLKELLDVSPELELVNGGDLEREISGIYCCDLLSIVMGRAGENNAWVTVMGNMNSVAVAVLADVSVIVLAEDIQADAVAIEKAKMQKVNIVKTALPVFEAAKLIDEKLNG